MRSYRAQPVPAIASRLALLACLGPLAALALFLFGGCNRGNTDDTAGPPAPLVEAVQARTGSLPLVERLSGTVWAENQTSLFPEISGRIAVVHVENGERVRRGDPLVTLADAAHREQLAQAEAGLRITEAQLRQAQARLAELQAQERRTRALGDRQLVTELELETQAAQVASGQADVALAEAQVERAQATLAEQEAMLERTIVRAPIDGVVGQRNAEVGMQATTASRLLTIGNLDRVEVRINVADTMLNYLAAGQRAEVIARTADGPRVLSGTVTRISPFLDPVSRMTEGQIELDNPGHILQPGMFVPVDVRYGESSRATLVPLSALSNDPNTGRPGVFVLGARADAAVKTSEHSDGGEPKPEPLPVSFQTVDVIARGAMEAAVTRVNEGQWVVTIGQDLLSTGRNQARVREVSWERALSLQQLDREGLLEEILRPGESDPST